MLALKELINNKESRFNLPALLLMGFSFFMPVHQKVSTLILIALVIVSLFKIKNINIKELIRLLPFLILYLLYIFAYHKDNFDVGLFMFEQKASLLAFPIIFSVLHKKNINVSIILTFFVYGCLAIYFYSLIEALCNSIDIHTFKFNATKVSHRETTRASEASYLLTNNFLANNFFKSMNSNFIAVYFSFAVFITINLKKAFKYKLFTISILVIGIFQAFSLMGFLCLLLSVIFSQFPKSYSFILISLLVVFLLSIFFISVGSKHEQNNSFFKNIESIDNRTIIWPIAFEAIAERPVLGLGVKKAQAFLEQKYPKTGEFGFISQLKKIDAHNMYIQIILEIGFLGFIVFVLNIVFFFRNIKQTKFMKFGLAFILVSLILFLTESALATYACLSFYCFFYCLLITAESKKLERNININQVNILSK